MGYLERELLAKRPDAIIQGQAQLELPIILSTSQRPLWVIRDRAAR